MEEISGELAGGEICSTSFLSHSYSSFEGRAKDLSQPRHTSRLSNNQEQVNLAACRAVGRHGAGYDGMWARSETGCQVHAHYSVRFAILDRSMIDI